MTITQVSPSALDQPVLLKEPGLIPTCVTAEARFYSFKELARRAGVSANLFRTWRIVVGHDSTTVYVQPGTQKRLRFPNAGPELWLDLLRGRFRTARFGWMCEPSDELRRSVPDFVVPFVQDADTSLQTLFQAEDQGCIDCKTDLLLSSLLSLSRWEELIISKRDLHGRVPARETVAYRDEFLMRPVVDEYGLALQQALQYLLPNWKPAPRQLRVNVSHDIDNIGVPFNLRTSLGHTLRRGSLAASLRDFAGLLPAVTPIYLAAVREIVLMDLKNGLVPAVYWKGSLRESIRQTYDPYHPKVKSMVRWLQDNGVETGVHPGYDTFRSPGLLKKDVETVRQLLGSKLIGGRQDFLRWCPDTWQDWENCGLTYDSTVGYADHIGFRAGTSLPYRPWLFRLNREARLIEIPLVVMDGTLTHYMQLNPSESLGKMRECMRRCRLVGGVFSLLWHNDSLLKTELSNVYPAILQDVAGHPKYDCAAPPADLY